MLTTDPATCMYVQVLPGNNCNHFLFASPFRVVRRTKSPGDKVTQLKTMPRVKCTVSHLRYIQFNLTNSNIRQDKGAILKRSTFSEMLTKPVAY